MRYRSRKDGRRIRGRFAGKREGAYGRLRRKNDNGEVHEVVDVTDTAAILEGYETSSDWTEVMLLGNRPDQDTVRDPYDGDPCARRPVDCDRISTTASIGYPPECAVVLEERH